MKSTTASRYLMAALVGALTLSLPAMAYGQQSGSFTITATADVATIEYFESRTPVIGAQAALAVVSPASAQASLDSLGTSMAFASAPYPGPIIVSLPGTASGPTGGAVPEYPFHVSSSFPVQKEQAVEEGPYLLRASSQAATSTGVARAGVASDGQSIGSTRAFATTSRKEGQLVTEAQSSGGAIAIDIIRISDLESVARMQVAPNGETTPTTKFSVSGLTVGGQGVEVTGEGLVIAGTTIPIDATPLAGELAKAGIELQLLSPQVGRSPNGATFARSAGLRISRTVEAPDGGSSKYVYTLGQSVVTATSTAFQPLGPAPDTNPFESTDPPAAASVGSPPSESPPESTHAVPPRLDTGQGTFPETAVEEASMAPPAPDAKAVPPAVSPVAAAPQRHLPSEVPPVTSTAPVST